MLNDVINRLRELYKKRVEQPEAPTSPPDWSLYRYEYVAMGGKRIGIVAHDAELGVLLEQCKTLPFIPTVFYVGDNFFEEEKVYHIGI